MTKDQFRALEEISGHRNPANSIAGSDRADNLLGAAISAFAGITRPGRQDMQQLEHLIMPLLHCASLRARRQAAGALAQLEDAPHRVILALASEPVEISAPLLLRSPLLRPGDLIDLISKYGLSHARVIARRQSGDKILETVLRSFSDSAIDRTLALQESLADIDGPVSGKLAKDALIDPEYLIDTALKINEQSFHDTLAKALDLSDEQTDAIIGQWPTSPLPVALKALRLSAADCFLVMTAVLGPVQSDHESLRSFVEFYRSIGYEKSMALIRRWKAEDMSAMLRSKLREMAQVANDTPSGKDLEVPALNRLAK
ncbi:DUF2336 domain-containing protein [Brucella sp. BE17]|uniref:DUF2336 domain-containing protein n=1 Tax=Brucella sp. BE17 TaxID=3142977 RepID=UPI0031BAFD37